MPDGTLSAQQLEILRVLASVRGPVSRLCVLQRRWHGQRLRALRRRGLIEVGWRETVTRWWGAGSELKSEHTGHEHLYRITALGRAALEAQLRAPAKPASTGYATLA